MKIINYNIRSFFKHIDDFICILNSCNYIPDVIVLTETWLTNDNKNAAIVEGYCAVHTIRENANSGGVSIFYKQVLNVEVLDKCVLSNISIETCSIKVIIKGNVFYFIGIYRPNQGNVADFIQYLNQVLNEISNINKNRVIILGDFNINLMLSGCNKVVSLSNFMRSHFFMPAVSNVTRFSPIEFEQPSLLDHVWLNFLNLKYHSTILLTDQTDHCPVITNIHIGLINENIIRIKFRDQSIHCINNFRYNLNLIEWQFSDDNDLNEKIIFFTETINNLYKKCFPLRTKVLNVKNIDKPWISPAIRNSIRTKSNYFKLFKQGIISHERNNAYKRVLSKTIRAAKRNYFFNYFKLNMNNVKKSWDGIRNLMGNNRQKKI